MDPFWTAVVGYNASYPEAERPLTDRQALARSAMTVQTVQMLALLGAAIGAVVGFVAPAMLLYDSLGQSNAVVWFLLCVGGGLLGLSVGSRVALMLIAR
jgi:hypothetical protein